MRERVFIVGHRFSQKIGPPPITHYFESQKKDSSDSNKVLAPQVSTGDAILDLPSLEAGEGKEKQPYSQEPNTNYQKWARGEQDVLYNHVAMKHTDRIVERFKRIQKGKQLAEVPEEYQVRKRNGNGELSDSEYHSNYRHLKPNEISYTIPASFYSSFIHPTQPRNITAREAARIQSFPDWYRFMGKRTVISSKLLQKKGRHDEDYLSQYNQIGNAVPPLLAKAIADHLKKFLAS
jgi:DNA (cytosine-5)-methyltransferase 1